jgi:quinol-cytochrome oxidoreductase complex cytochrome b subunit
MSADAVNPMAMAEDEAGDSGAAWAPPARSSVSPGVDRRQLGGVDRFFEDRLQWRFLFNVFMHVRIPATVNTFYFGGIALFLFGVQVVTGTLLTLYYEPTPETAYDSVLRITSSVDFGWLIRSVHHWGATLMLAFVLLHLLRIFFQAAYKFPRELTWIVGSLLLMITIGFGFTGYLLPWDQRAYWATVVGTQIAGGVPGIGDFALQFLRDGADVTGATLTRFFGIHVLVLPLALAGLLAVHLLFVHQQGLADPTRPSPRPAKDGSLPPETGEVEPFFPNYILDEVIAWYVVLGVLVVLASLLPAGLEAKADPLVTPEGIKPEWYFLAVYELLKMVPKLVGILAPIGLVGIVTILPLIDRNPEVRPRRRILAIGVALILLAGMVVLTAIGLQSEAPAA